MLLEFGFLSENTLLATETKAVTERFGYQLHLYTGQHCEH